MNIKDIHENISEGRSVIMYKQDIKAIIPELAAKWTVIYIPEPIPPHWPVGSWSKGFLYS